MNVLVNVGIQPITINYTTFLKGKHAWSHLAYKYHLYFQINAHDGGLNDITFIRRNRQLFIATCGDDHTVKVIKETV